MRCKQVAHLDIGVAVVAVLDLAALAEERIGLVEEEHGAARLGRVEDGAQILLGLADVLRHDAREVDAVEIEREIVGDRLPRPWSCRCRSAPTAAARCRGRADIFGETVRAIDQRLWRTCAAAALRSWMTSARQHDVVPAVAGHDAIGQFVEFAARPFAAGLPQIAALRGGRRDRARPELELRARRR